MNIVVFFFPSFIFHRMLSFSGIGPPLGWLYRDLGSNSDSARPLAHYINPSTLDVMIAE